MRRATSKTKVEYADLVISIHALREESDFGASDMDAISVISIHALREESDKACFAIEPLQTISIHALREESDRKQYTLR